MTKKRKPRNAEPMIDEGTVATLQALKQLRPGQTLTYAAGIPTSRRPDPLVMLKVCELIWTGDRQSSVLAISLWGH